MIYYKDSTASSKCLLMLKMKISNKVFRATTYHCNQSFCCPMDRFAGLLALYCAAVTRSSPTAALRFPWRRYTMVFKMPFHSETSAVSPPHRCNFCPLHLCAIWLLQSEGSNSLPSLCCNAPMSSNVRNTQPAHQTADASQTGLAEGGMEGRGFELA